MSKGNGTDDRGEGDGRGQGLDGGGGVRHQRQQGNEQQKKALGLKYHCKELREVTRIINICNFCMARVFLRTTCTTVPKNLGRGLPLPPHPQIHPKYTVCEKWTKKLGKALPPLIWTKSKRTATFFRETFPKSQVPARGRAKSSRAQLKCNKYIEQKKP